MVETRKPKGVARDAGLERRWRRLLAGHARSGMTVRAYCRKARVPETAFYYWRGEVLRRDRESGERQPAMSRRDRAAKGAAGGKPAAASFSEVEVKRGESTSTCRGSEIDVILPSAVVVRVGRSVDEEQLRRVLAAVEAKEC